MLVGVLVVQIFTQHWLVKILAHALTHMHDDVLLASMHEGASHRL